MEPDTAGDLLRRQIESGEQLLANRPVSKGAFSSWLVAARGCVEWIYGKDSDSYRTYTASSGVVSVPLNPGEASRRADKIEDHLAKLRGLWTSTLRQQPQPRDVLHGRLALLT